MCLLGKWVCQADALHSRSQTDSVLYVMHDMIIDHVGVTNIEDCTLWSSILVTQCDHVMPDM